MKVVFICTDWGTDYRIATGEYGGVGYYRAYAPAKELRKRGHTVDVMGHDLVQHLDKNDVFNSYKKLFSNYDLVVVKQLDTSNSSKMLGACKDLGVPIAMDLDDLVTELDEDNPAIALGYEKGGTKRAFSVASLSMVDALITSTQPLADEYKDYLMKTLKVEMPMYVLPNCCDTDLWVKQHRNEDRYKIIGWQGSITHDGDLKLILPAMKQLMEEYPDLVLSLTGGVRQETYDKIIKKSFTKSSLERIITLRGTPSFNNFPEYLSRHQWDIGVVPLKDTRFTRCKSHIKWMENSLLCVPSVVSAVYPYTEPIQGTDVIVDGETGILVKNIDDWYKQLKFAIDNPDKMKYIARDAYRFVRENWKYSDHIEKWEQAFDKIISEGSKDL